MLVSDIPEDFILVTNSQDIEYFIGSEKKYGCIFVDDNLDIIYGCYSNIPYLNLIVERIK